LDRFALSEEISIPLKAAVQHRVAQRHERVDAAEHQAIDDLSGEDIQAAAFFVGEAKN
jgi:hypothetical protein